jgi:ABC-type transport system involved in multi-copper enzyme maturation permease subunit
MLNVFPRSGWRDRFYAANLLRQRLSAATFFSWGIYITMALALVVGAVLLENNARYTQQNVIAVIPQPLFVPIWITTVLTALYLGLTGALTLARERDKGTIEVLLYGPVDEIAYLLGLFLAQLSVYAVLAVVALLWSNFAIWWLNLQFAWELSVILLYSLLTTSAIVAFGLWVAAWGGRARATLILFILVTVGMLAIQVADQAVTLYVVTAQPGITDPMLVIRDVLVGLTAILQWFSPFEQMRLAMDALLARDGVGVALNASLTTLQTLFWLVTGVVLLKWKGVRG